MTDVGKPNFLIVLSFCSQKGTGIKSMNNEMLLLMNAYGKLFTGESTEFITMGMVNI